MYYITQTCAGAVEGGVGEGGGGKTCDAVMSKGVPLGALYGYVCHAVCFLVLLYGYVCHVVWILKAFNSCVRDPPLNPEP
jgi:hypothetical protein